MLKSLGLTNEIQILALEANVALHELARVISVQRDRYTIQSTLR